MTKAAEMEEWTVNAYFETNLQKDTDRELAHCVISQNLFSFLALDVENFQYLIN